MLRVLTDEEARAWDEKTLALPPKDFCLAVIQMLLNDFNHDEMFAWCNIQHAEEMLRRYREKNDHSRYDEPGRYQERGT